MSPQPSQPEFSRPFQLEDVREEPVKREVSADEQELEALRERYGVDELKNVRANLSIAPFGSKGVRVTGEAMASVVQSCVVTLESVEEHVVEKIDTTYLPEGNPSLEIMDETAIDEEDIELLDGETVDLGELVAQQIAAAINPYPRADGAEFGKADALSDNGDGVRENPFAVLKGLRPADGNAEEDKG